MKMLSQAVAKYLTEGELDVSVDCNLNLKIIINSLELENYIFYLGDIMINF